MSGYEVEHNIKSEATSKARRPDLSTFFSTYELVDTSGEHTPHHNANALAQPENISAAFRTLANAFLAMEHDQGGSGENPVLEEMIQHLVQFSEDPPDKVDGVPDTFIEDLDRVRKEKLEGKDCPICGLPFLEGVLLSFHDCFYVHWMDWS